MASIMIIRLWVYTLLLLVPMGLFASGGVPVLDLGVVVAKDGPNELGEPYLFLKDRFSGVWLALRNSAGTLSWKDLGCPQEDEGSDCTNITASLGALVVKDGPNKQSRPYVFGLGNDGNVWNLWRNMYGEWAWSNLGCPKDSEGSDCAKITLSLGAVPVRNDLTGSELPHVFVHVADSSDVWVLRWDPYKEKKWIWDKLGCPPNSKGTCVKFRYPLGAVVVEDNSSGAMLPHVFALGDSGNVWNLSRHASSNNSWKWSSLSCPGSLDDKNCSGSKNYIPLDGAPNVSGRPYIFMYSLDDQHVWSLSRNPDTEDNWGWTRLPDIRGRGLDSRIVAGSATVVKDDRPYIFLIENTGKYYNLMLDEYGSWISNPLGCLGSKNKPCTMNYSFGQAITLDSAPNLSDEPYLFLVDFQGIPRLLGMSKSYMGIQLMPYIRHN